MAQLNTTNNPGAAYRFSSTSRRGSLWGEECPDENKSTSPAASSWSAQRARPPGEAIGAVETVLYRISNAAGR
jgi:hypothetical protein